MPLDPQRLTPAASLNRVPFVASPSMAIPAAYEGRHAFSLLSAYALNALVLEHRDELRITAQEDALGPSYALRARLADPSASAAASAIVSEYGRRLGYLIAILKRGDAESRAARPEWDETYWTHWGSIERVYLGGGLAWPEVCAAARSVVRELGAPVDLVLAPYPAYRPLVGAARSLGQRSGVAAALDFGQTATKVSRAGYEAGMLTRLDVMPEIPASKLDGTAYIEWIASTVASSLTDEASVAGVCVSSYLDDHQHPAAYVTGGRFAAIRESVPNLRAWLSAEVSKLAGRRCDVQLFHDTSAAAAGLSPAVRSAVLMLGTALGSGFPSPDGTSLAPIAPSFSVTLGRD